MDYSEDNLQGLQINELTFIEPVEDLTSTSPSHRRWRVQCSCGETKETKAYQVISENTKSCGHLRGQHRALDLQGETFGELKALSPTRVEWDNRDVRGWLCECNCGRLTKVKTGHLTSGHTTTCGHTRHYPDRFEHLRRDLRGERIGLLVVKNPTHKKTTYHKKNLLSAWDCECDCGQSTTVLTSQLVKRATKSCGCLQKGLKGETHHRWAKQRDVKSLKTFFGYKCMRCGAYGEDDIIHLDHVVPRSRGGCNSFFNIQFLCESCNLKKWANIDDWRPFVPKPWKLNRFME